MKEIVEMNRRDPNTQSLQQEQDISAELLSAWRGRILIITSQDDGGYEDSQALSEKLPNAQLLVFEKGYGHMAPLVKSHEMYLAIDRLMAELS